MIDEDMLLIDKPVGISSFDVIRRLRTKTGIRKFGHAGTLDPRASGLMIIGKERGTKKLADYLKLDKEYVAEVLIGEKRTTGDLEGRVVEACPVSELSHETVAEAVAQLVGSHTLHVSVYSAIKIDGAPLYKKARKAEKTGEEMTEAPTRTMTVYASELLGEWPFHYEGADRYIIKVRFHVASGTYIRSLAEELGRMLGYPATLYSLRRTKIGDYRVEDAEHI